MFSDRLAGLSRAFSARASRRLAIGGGAALALTGHTAALAQTGDTAAAGIGAPGANAFEFVGVVQQRGFEFTIVSYITALAGVDRALLFSSANPLERSEASARLALVGSGIGTARSILRPLFVVSAAGGGAFRAIDGASFEEPETFLGGAAVAEGAVELTDIINVQAPQTGIAIAHGSFELAVSEEFELGGQPVTIASAGQRYRLFLTGQGQLHNPDTLEATVLVAGHGVAAA